MSFQPRVVLHLSDGGPERSELQTRLLREGYRVARCRRPELLVHWLRIRRFSALVGEGLAAASLALLNAEFDALHGLPIVLYGPVHHPHAAGKTRDLAIVAVESGESVDLVIAHLRALLRRANGYPPHLRLGPLGVDLARGRASVAGRPLTLRPKELELLAHLVQAAGEPMAAEVLVRRLWSEGTRHPGRLKVLVSNLRHRLRRHPLGSRNPVEHVPGCGYRLHRSLYEPACGRPVGRPRKAERSE